MNKNRRIIILLAVLLVLVAGFAIFSKNDSIKNIKELTEQLDQQTDSLGLIHDKYDSLSVQYDMAIAQLDTTATRLRNFKDQVDSITNARINNLSAVNKALKDVIDKNAQPIELDSTKTDFRFR